MEKDEPMQETGTAVEENDSEPDASSRGTETSSAMSLSGCKPSSKRSKRHREKKAMLSMQRAQQKREAAGGTWEPTKSRDEWVSAKQKSMAQYVMCTDDVSLIEMAFRQTINDDIVIDERIADIVREEEARFLATDMSGWEWCRLCGCSSNEQHRRGARHVTRAVTHAFDTYFLGAPDDVRQHTVGYKVNDGLLTDKGLASYWGRDILEFHRRSSTAITSRGEICFKKSDNAAGIMVPTSHLGGWNTGIVNFRAHQGKYSDTTTVYFPHQLPAEVEVNSEWWPVCVFGLKPEPEIMRKYSDLNITTRAFFTCVRQMADRGQIVAWPLVLRLRGGPPPLPPLRDEGVWEPVDPPPPVPPPPPPPVPPPPPEAARPPTWGDAAQPGAIARGAEEVD
jgi:hypothetical protein